MSLRREAAIVAIGAVIVEAVQLAFDRLRYELNERARKKKVAQRPRNRRKKDRR